MPGSTDIVGGAEAVGAELPAGKSAPLLSLVGVVESTPRTSVILWSYLFTIILASFSCLQVTCNLVPILLSAAKAKHIVLRRQTNRQYRTGSASPTTSVDSSFLVS